VGTVQTADGTIRAVLWIQGQAIELGVLPTFAQVVATRVARSGRAPIVVGMGERAGDLSGHGHALLWNGSALTDLGFLPDSQFSKPLSVNAQLQVVGVSGGAEQHHGMPVRAFLWEDGTMIDLNSLLPPNSGWMLSDAQDINDVGEIVGTGLRNGQFRAYLLSPQ
jgi:probable HAF family extracellular repeat protein